MHRARWLSSPLQCTLSRRIFPERGPKWAPKGADTARPHPSCLHTTCASFRSQPSPHTDPQVPW
ncbi:unnamed protein product [Gulo gulo]|uniref:Uncharacterized protein n=1 Tax=Gulo gulo TaxID=48420 RepID=A0A9X9LWE2_GULGU|nr:unnamed protein product [Gulo gulo]